MQPSKSRDVLIEDALLRGVVRDVADARVRAAAAPLDFRRLRLRRARAAERDSFPANLALHIGRCSYVGVFTYHCCRALATDVNCLRVDAPGITALTIIE